MKINKILTRISFIALSFITFFSSKVSFADNGNNAGTSNTSSGIQNPLSVNGSGISSIPEAVTALMGFVVQIGAVVAIFAFVYSGYLFVKARGNEKELGTAKDVFINTVIGVAVLLGAQLIASIVVGTINNLKR
jgi:hypothetical protein